MRMKAGCIVLTILIVIAIMAVCVMVKYATDITVQERKRGLSPSGGVYQVVKSMGVITLSDNASTAASNRFPYVAAIIRNSSASWSFACFASIILVKWVVTSAHCRREGATHRVLLYHDFIRNYSHTYPILFWRLHEKYNDDSSMISYDIAVAKMNVEHYTFSLKASVFDDKEEVEVVTSVWKTVSTMDKMLYLTNDFDMFHGTIADSGRCFETYGVELDDSLVCVDFSSYTEDCFIHEIGPVYAGDKVVAILTVKPTDCDVKHLIFTNVSYYSNWILRSTHTL